MGAEVRVYCAECSSTIGPGGAALDLAERTGRDHADHVGHVVQLVDRRRDRIVGTIHPQPELDFRHRG